MFIEKCKIGITRILMIQWKRNFSPLLKLVLSKVQKIKNSRKERLCDVLTIYSATNYQSQAPLLQTWPLNGQWMLSGPNYVCPTVNEEHIWKGRGSSAGLTKQVDNWQFSKQFVLCPSSFCESILRFNCTDQLPEVIRFCTYDLFYFATSYPKRD